MLNTVILAFCCSVLAGAETGGQLGVKTQRNVPVPMRDGVILRADVHRPDRGGPYPVLVRRSTYGKGRNFDRYVKAGYIVVSQDARGRFASDGKWESFMRAKTHDGEDGYDTVEWAARLPGSTGKVGTFGLSYNALLQWRMATLHPPSLVAMAARSVHPYTREASGSIRPGRRLPWWIKSTSPDMHRRSKRALPESYKKWVAGGQKNWLYFLPWLELPDEVFGHWIVRLIDVAPDGLARDVSMRLVRARYRHGLDKPELITPGEVVKYTIRMNATSNAFLPGHRIRLDITSSDFPNYDRNHNTAADQNADAQLKTARQTIHHGKAHPTRIILPWVPNSAAAAPFEASTALPDELTTVDLST